MVGAGPEDARRAEPTLKTLITCACVSQVQGRRPDHEKFHLLQDVRFQLGHHGRAAEIRRGLQNKRRHPGEGLVQESELHPGRHP